MKSYLFLFLMMTSFCIMAQNGTVSELQLAKDSLNSNPNFTYNSLSKLLKRSDLEASLRVDIHERMANYFSMTGVTDSAIYYAEKALFKVRNEKQQVAINRILGSVYARSGRKEEALPILLESLAISERNQDTDMICKLKRDLGNLYFYKDEFDKALQYYEESAKIALDKNSQALIKNNIGNVYVRKGKLVIAERYYHEILGLVKVIENPNLVLNVHSNIGAIALERKRYDEAAKAFKNARDIAQKYNLHALLTLTSYNLGLVLNAKGDGELAMATFQDALQNAKNSENLEHQKLVYDGMIQACDSLGDYRNKSQVLESYHAIVDSINKLEFDKEIKQLEIEYETTQKEKEIERQKSVKIWLIIGTSALLIPIAILMFMYYQKHKTQISLNKSQKEVNDQKVSAIIRDHERELIHKAIEIQNNERQRIGQQLHDVVGGNLSLIKLKLSQLKSKNSDILTMQQQLTETLEQVRDLSHDLISKKIRTSTFIAVIKNYTEQSGKASNKKVNLFAHPEKELDSIKHDYQVTLFKIIQELMNNSIKHSNAHKIEIHLNMHQKNINLIFEDDGIGFQPKSLKNGIGLQNIKNRVHKLSGTLEIDSGKGKGTIINLNFKLL